MKTDTDVELEKGEQAVGKPVGVAFGAGQT